MSSVSPQTCPFSSQPLLLRVRQRMLNGLEEWFLLRVEDDVWCLHMLVCCLYSHLALRSLLHATQELMPGVYELRAAKCIFLPGLSSPCSSRADFPSAVPLSQTILWLRWALANEPCSVHCSGTCLLELSASRNPLFIKSVFIKVCNTWLLKTVPGSRQT